MLVLALCNLALIVVCWGLILALENVE